MDTLAKPGAGLLERNTLQLEILEALKRTHLSGKGHPQALLPILKRTQFPGNREALIETALQVLIEQKDLGDIHTFMTTLIQSCPNDAAFIMTRSGEINSVLYEQALSEQKEAQTFLRIFDTLHKVRKQHEARIKADEGTENAPPYKDIDEMHFGA